MTAQNVNQHEINKFGSHAERWWDVNGELKTLHDINPLRMQFIQQHVELTGKRVVDIGCGGGILTESLVQAGADALGIDLSDELIEIAELHGLESGLSAAYQTISAEELADRHPGEFDYVTCMEMLEHVPDPAAIIHACARLVKPNGVIFFSTLNRVPKAYLLAILAAEYLLKMLPQGTHDYKSFIKPSELSQTARQSGLSLTAMAGIQYQPFSKRFSLGKDIDVNYIAAYTKSA